LTTFNGDAVPEAITNISWLPFDPRDWEQLTPAFGRLRSMVGAHGPKLIADNRAAAFFDRCVHEGLLELALVAPDLTYRLFDAAERQKLTIRVPLNYEEGCSIEPYHEGHWYVQRSNLEKLTAIPVTPVARAEAELVPARIPPAESASVPPAESPRVKPGRDVGAADGPVQGMQVEPGGPQLPSAASKPASAANVGDQAGVAAVAIEAAAPPPEKRLRTPGRPPEKRGPAAEKMRADLRAQRLTPDDLRSMKQEVLAVNYGCSRTTACKARDDVLSEIVGNSIPDNF
jgi:hypothetical protein